jgi:hypothetical protein
VGLLRYSVVLGAGMDMGRSEPVGTGAVVVSTDTLSTLTVSGILLVVRL